MAGPWQVNLGDLLIHRPGVHPLLPVGVVAVGDLQRDRTAERATVADACRDLGGVALDLHTPAATVPQLAARHVLVEVLGSNLKTRGQALDDAREPRPVRLTGCDQTERHVASLFAAPSQPLIAAPHAAT